MILEITLGFFVILTIALSYAVYNLLIKQEQLEDWVEDYITKINEVNTNIRKIDYKGYFEVDDEMRYEMKYEMRYEMRNEMRNEMRCEI